MAPFIHILAFASLAILGLSFQVNALAADRAEVARDIHNHHAIARRKRNTSSSRCIPRPTSAISTSTPSIPTSTSTSSPLPLTTTTTQPSTTSAAPTSTPTTGSKKWGLGYGADPQYMSNFDTLPAVEYLYNWTPNLPSGIPSSITGIPQFWGNESVSTWDVQVINQDYSVIFTMNEPEIPTQANLAVGDALSLWSTNIDPISSWNHTIYAPAITNSPEGLQWITNFTQQCQTAVPPCNFNAYNVHLYTTSAQDAINFVLEVHNTFNMDVAITEFACQDYSPNGNQATMNEVWDFAGQLKQFINDNDWITMAFPFGLIMPPLPNNVNPDNELMNTDGTPTALAQFYFS